MKSDSIDIGEDQILLITATAAGITTTANTVMLTTSFSLYICDRIPFGYPLLAVRCGRIALLFEMLFHFLWLKYSLREQEIISFG